VKLLKFYFFIYLPDVSGSGYNYIMQIVQRHTWQVTPAEAIKIQAALAGEVLREGTIKLPRFIAGVDISVNRLTKTGTAAVVVLGYPGLEIAEVQVVTDHISFPYVPGLLTFREAPLTLAACEKLALTPDIVIVDGQGYAHPRRIGLASHLGLCLDTPTIGCAKSRLIGEHAAPAMEARSYVDLLDNGEVIGAVVRTRSGVSPVFVSVGHRLSLPSAVRWVLACCRGFRLPEPTRLAHMAAGGNLKVPSMIRSS
jgi:deoxyribonuclease V